MTVMLVGGVVKHSTESAQYSRYVYRSQTYIPYNEFLVATEIDWVEELRNLTCIMSNMNKILKWCEAVLT